MLRMKHNKKVFTLKTAIVRDSYKFQSHATIYMHDGKEWVFLAKIPYPQMQCVKDVECIPGRTEPAFLDAAAIDRKTLIKKAEIILCVD
jgi:hypothetical protein